MTMREADSADIARDQANAEEGEMQHDQQRHIRRTGKARDLLDMVAEAWDEALCDMSGCDAIAVDHTSPDEGTSISVCEGHLATWEHSRVEMDLDTIDEDHDMGKRDLTSPFDDRWE